jgi:hypothetical protein
MCSGGLRIKMLMSVDTFTLTKFFRNPQLLRIYAAFAGATLASANVGAAEPILEYKGVGLMIVQEQHYPKIVDVYQESPAYPRRDILIGAFILGIAEETDTNFASTRDVAVSNIVRMLHGPVGTKARVRLSKNLPPDGGTYVEPLEREWISAAPDGIFHGSFRLIVTGDDLISSLGTATDPDLPRASTKLEPPSDLDWQRVAHRGEPLFKAKPHISVTGAPSQVNNILTVHGRAFENVYALTKGYLPLPVAFKGDAILFAVREVNGSVTFHIFNLETDEDTRIHARYSELFQVMESPDAQYGISVVGQSVVILTCKCAMSDHMSKPVADAANILVACYLDMLARSVKAVRSDYYDKKGDFVTQAVERGFGR